MSGLNGPTEATHEPCREGQTYAAADLANPLVALVESPPLEHHREIVVGETGTAVPHLQHGVRQATSVAVPGPPKLSGGRRDVTRDRERRASLRPLGRWHLTAAGRTASTTGPPGGTTRSAFSSSPSTIWRTRPGSVRTNTAWLGSSVRSRTPTAAQRPPQTSAALVAKRDQLDLHDLEREVVRLQPGQHEQVLHEPVQVLGLGQHRLTGPLGTVGPHDPVGQRLGVPLDGGQRGTELVGDRQ